MAREALNAVRQYFEDAQPQYDYRPDAKPRPKSDWELALFNCPDIGKVGLAVALAYGRHADFETGLNCFPGSKRVAAMVGLADTGALRRHRDVLVAMGWLSYRGPRAVDSSPFPHDEYWLTIPACHKHDGTELPDVRDK